MTERIPPDYERTQHLKYVRGVAENLLGAHLVDDDLNLYDYALDHIADFSTFMGQQMDVLCWNLLGLRSEALDYTQIIDFCTGELAEEMDGTDE